MSPIRINTSFVLGGNHEFQQFLFLPDFSIASLEEGDSPAGSVRSAHRGGSQLWILLHHLHESLQQRSHISSYSQKDGYSE